MKRPSYFYILIIVGFLVVSVSLFVVEEKPAQKINEGQELKLRVPPFVERARAENSEIGQYLDDEAGISAYYQAPDLIDLNDVRGVFSTIEIETSNYIIGSVSVPNHPDLYDTHVYVHIDGWILAYYLNTDPVAKMFQLKTATGQNLQTTILQDVLGIVASAANVPFTSASYYDFRYPNATHVMAIVENTSGGATDTFEINLPGSYYYYERSFRFYYEGASGSLVLDGVGIGGFLTQFGTLTEAQLSPDVFHTFATNCHALGHAHSGVAVVYRIP